MATLDVQHAHVYAEVSPTCVRCTGCLVAGGSLAVWPVVAGTAAGASAPPPVAPLLGPAHEHIAFDIIIGQVIVQQHCP